MGIYFGVLNISFIFGGMLDISDINFGYRVYMLGPSLRFKIESTTFPATL